MEMKEKSAKAVVRLVKQLRDKCSLDVIGSLDQQEDLLGGTVRMVPTTDGSRWTYRNHLLMNLGSHSDDAEYMAALTKAEAEYVRFL